MTGHGNYYDVDGTAAGDAPDSLLCAVSSATVGTYHRYPEVSHDW